MLILLVLACLVLSCFIAINFTFYVPKILLDFLVFSFG